MQTEEEFYSEEGKKEREQRIKIFWNCGIYCIINLLNDNRYIGSSTNLKQRFGQHRCDLRHNRHHNQHLQNAWNKYGEENFKFEVIEHWEYFEKVLGRENKNISLYKPEYNNIQVNEDHLFFHSDETKKKIGIKSSEKFIKNPQLKEDCINRLKGKPTWNKGLKGIYSKETLTKMSNSRKIPILQYDLEGNFIKEWESGLDAAIYYGATNSGNFSRVVKENTRLYNSYWRRNAN